MLHFKEANNLSTYGVLSTYRVVCGFQSRVDNFVKKCSFIEASFAFWFLKKLLEKNGQKIQAKNEKVCLEKTWDHYTEGQI